MKRIIAIIIIIVICISLSACCVSHEWKDATCTDPKTCIKCGKTEGSPLGHTWEDATCIKAKTCSTCGITEGAALGHQATPATCTEDSVCSVCGTTVEKATGHQAEPATCTGDSVCSVCGEVVEKATGHKWVGATAGKPKTCTICGITEGEPLGYQYFPKDTYEFINAYNKSKNALGKLDKDFNEMKIIGTNLKIVFFVWDVSERETPPGMWAIPKMEFNAMAIRLIVNGTTRYDTNGQSAITLIGESFATVFDSTFDSHEMLSNGSYSVNGNSFTLTYSHNGFDYTIEGSPSTSSYYYTFKITLSVNK